MKYNFLKTNGEIHVKMEDFDKAAAEGVSLTSYLNKQYKEVVEMYDGELDAFDIALLSNGIRVRENRELGLSSSPLNSFFTTNENRNLFKEFVVRELRQISGKPSIVNDLVGSTRIIEGDSAKQVILELTNDTETGKSNKKNLRKQRISEAANIPVKTIKLGETAIKIYKYGIGVEITYEAARRTTIDMFRKFMELVNVEASYDEVDTIVDVILNGDGNSAATKVFKASQLGSDKYESGKIDEKTLIAYLIKQNFHVFDTIIVGDVVLVDLITTLMDKNLTNAANPQLQFSFPNVLKNLKVVYHEGLGKSTDGKTQIIGLAKDYAIEKVIEADSTIRETERIMANQTQRAYLTENAGFNKLDSRASSILVLD